MDNQPSEGLFPLGYQRDSAVSAHETEYRQLVREVRLGLSYVRWTLVLPRPCVTLEYADDQKDNMKTVEQGARDAIELLAPIQRHLSDEKRLDSSQFSTAVNKAFVTFRDISDNWSNYFKPSKPGEKRWVDDVTKASKEANDALRAAMDFPGSEPVRETRARVAMTLLMMDILRKPSQWRLVPDAPTRDTFIDKRTSARDAFSAVMMHISGAKMLGSGQWEAAINKAIESCDDISQRWPSYFESNTAGQLWVGDLVNRSNEAKAALNELAKMDKAD